VQTAAPAAPVGRPSVVLDLDSVEPRAAAAAPAFAPSGSGRPQRATRSSTER